ncbi:DUF3347 domain-containing protein [Wenyingzhuangia sp. chi5]|uniref:DUF3347 domain-containing protein n=1 Tax=Wenyingzhuangia gilva TaxID=3057677 RepID=A0ABT8VMX5_9FLAO|nr:DUF3347 domain-containing protein [Wenyingzhuangia sp. chi5]MDO3693325.1 DUF3347 domain-containing protein [Wenyingzhuangia sp. chi5]
MKNLILIVLLSISYLSQAQTSSYQEVTPDLVEKREELKKEITDNYLLLKNSLIISDSLSVKKNASQLKESLGKFKFKKLKLAQMNEAVKIRREIIELATELIDTGNINKQRNIFQTLSSKFWQIADKLKAKNVTLYLQVCPMTNAKWVSDSDKIENPFYPKNMLTCGEVKASLK